MASPNLYGRGGEQAQTYFLERQHSIHRNLNHLLRHKGAETGGSSSSLRRSASAEARGQKGGPSNGGSPRLGPNRFIPTSAVNINKTLSGNSITITTRRSYGTLATDVLNTIRFQCVVWNIGRLDVVAASVPMTFRVTLFWNDVEAGNDDFVQDDLSTYSSNTAVNVWKMHNRDKAFAAPLSDHTGTGQKPIEVPPLSILNCSSFEIIGSPTVTMLCDSTRLMRWSCMYRANMLQEGLRVDAFPHDDHDICIKLAILSHRGKGRQWDRNIWKLALATKEDSQCSTAIPEGLLVDHARLPGFSYNKKRGLDFSLRNLEHGAFDDRANQSHDQYLRVSLNVLRESGYYDKNIVPLVALMNVVAVSVLTFKDSEFFYRALITNNIAFVQMSIRMTADSHLPSVGYQIRLQRILNEFFFVLMCLVLEAMIVYVLTDHFDVSMRITRGMDFATGAMAVSHNAITVGRYYRSMRNARERLERAEAEVPTKDGYDMITNV